MNKYKIILFIVNLYIFGVFENANAQGISKIEQRLISQIDKNYAEIMQLLEQVVNINSGTLNVAGVKEVGMVFAKEFESIGFYTEWIDLPPEHNRAGHLVATIKGNKGKRLFLIGHLDTVFEKDMPFQPFTVINDSTATGQGVNDMKGGDVMVLASLKALHQFGLLKDRSVTVYFTGDEENAADGKESREDFISRAKNHDIALAYETAQGFDIATVARRGSSGWILKTSGKQAHSSGIFKESVGYGAIYEAVRILNEFREQLGDEKYLTFNPGQIMGGSDVSLEESNGRGIALGKTNIVSRETITTGDLRFLGESQKEAARSKMKTIVAQNLKGTSAEIAFKDGIPSMPPSDGNLALVSILNEVSLSMGYGAVKAGDPGSRGAGDISYVANYLDCMDGIGASGTGAHSPNETINIKEFPSLIKRNTVLLYRLLHDK